MAATDAELQAHVEVRVGGRDGGVGESGRREHGFTLHPEGSGVRRRSDGRNVTVATEVLRAPVGVLPSLDERLIGNAPTAQPAAATPIPSRG